MENFFLNIFEKDRCGVYKLRLFLKTLYKLKLITREEHNDIDSHAASYDFYEENDDYGAFYSDYEYLEDEETDKETARDRKICGRKSSKQKFVNICKFT